MIATTLEQSKNLVELGIDPSTADMYFEEINFAWGLQVGRCHKPNTVPAWSLTALLELMPRSIKSEKNGQTYLSFHRGYEDNWMIEYSFEDIDMDYLEVKFEQRNPVDAAFEMVCWLKENNKL